MSSVWIAGLIALAAIVATYFSCVRPHLRNRGGCGMTGDAELDRQVAELREELRLLRTLPPPTVVVTSTGGDAEYVS
jgi:hypothetical protein